MTATITPAGRADSVRPAGVTEPTPIPPASGRTVGAGLKSLIRNAPLLPFVAYTGVFLLLPTALVIIGAFTARDGGFTLEGIVQALNARTAKIFWTTTWLALVTAIIGAAVGAVIAYALSTAPQGSVSRRIITAFNSVLAQFGGVMLAFAFIAMLGTNGMVTRLMEGLLGVSVPSNLLSSMAGIVLVYIYFQIPLMVIVFLPAVDGLRTEWRETTMSFGGTTATFWRSVAGPILAPRFLGSLLLLFANAFSAFATAAALISQQTIIVPMAIESAIRNENNTNMNAYAQVLALGMILVIALIMTGYAALQRKTARWEQ